PDFRQALLRTGFNALQALSPNLVEFCETFFLRPAWALKKQRLIILVDGLDEVNDPADREALKHLIVQADLPHLRWILTTRREEETYTYASQATVVQLRADLEMNHAEELNQPPGSSLLRLEGRLVAHEDHVDCVAWSPDAKMLASGSYDNTIRVWDAQ